MAILCPIQITEYRQLDMTEISDDRTLYTITRTMVCTQDVHITFQKAVYRKHGKSRKRKHNELNLLYNPHKLKLKRLPTL